VIGNGCDFKKYIPVFGCSLQNWGVNGLAILIKGLAILALKQLHIENTDQCHAGREEPQTSRRLLDYIQLSFLGRLLDRVNLIEPVCHLYIRTYVCPSIHKKCFPGLSILHTGRCVPHEGMPYDSIRGQGHETFRVRNPSIFKVYFIRHVQLELASGK